MTPKIKIAFRAALGCFGLFVAFLTFYFSHSFIAIILVVITTLFASSSKFAKEVNNIQLWKKVMGGYYNDYPQTEEQFIACIDSLQAEFSVFMQDFMDVKDQYDAGKKKYHGRHLGPQLESKIAHYEMAIHDFWRLLEYFGLLPLDPASQSPWEGWKPFVENAYMNPPALNDIFRGRAIDQVFA